MVATTMDLCGDVGKGGGARNIGLHCYKKDTHTSILRTGDIVG